MEHGAQLQPQSLTKLPQLGASAKSLEPELITKYLRQTLSFTLQRLNVRTLLKFIAPSSKDLDDPAPLFVASPCLRLQDVGLLPAPPLVPSPSFQEEKEGPITLSPPPQKLSPKRSKHPSKFFLPLQLFLLKHLASLPYTTSNISISTKIPPPPESFSRLLPPTGVLSIPRVSPSPLAAIPGMISNTNSRDNTPSAERLQPADITSPALDFVTLGQKKNDDRPP